MCNQRVNREASRNQNVLASVMGERLCVAFGTWLGFIIVLASAAPTVGAVVYSELFGGSTVPSNWVAQNGTMGTASLAIADESGGIGTGNALSITSNTRQGVIGSFPDVMFSTVGETIELRFDVRLTQFANNAGGFRFGLYNDNDGAAFSSGYRALMGTGANYLSTDVQADGGDADIAFGTNRENPPGFQSDLPGINDNLPHSLALILTRTIDGVAIDVWQDGASNFPAPVEHIMGMGAGTPTPVQTTFNQIVFTTNGGYTGLIDNVRVNVLAPAPPGDVTGDGIVNVDDFNIILAAMFTQVGSRTEGDLTGDGLVDFADYRQWKDAAKSGVGASEGSVPEPSGFICMSGLALGFILIASKRGRARYCG